MDLKTYLESNNIHPKDFAKKAGINVEDLEAIIKKKIIPSKKIVKKITKASNNAVKIKNFFDINDWQRMRNG